MCAVGSQRGLGGYVAHLLKRHTAGYEFLNQIGAAVEYHVAFGLVRLGLHARILAVFLDQRVKVLAVGYLLHDLVDLVLYVGIGGLDQRLILLIIVVGLFGQRLKLAYRLRILILVLNQNVLYRADAFGSVCGAIAVHALQGVSVGVVFVSRLVLGNLLGIVLGDIVIGYGNVACQVGIEPVVRFLRLGLLDKCLNGVAVGGQLGFGLGLQILFGGFAIVKAIVYALIGLVIGRLSFLGECGYLFIGEVKVAALLLHDFLYLGGNHGVQCDLL